MVPSSSVDLSLVLNAHREGALAHPTLRSVGLAVRRAQRDGLSVEVVAVLDRPDDATRAVIREAIGPGGVLERADGVRLIEVDNGDLGLSRNDGIAASVGACVGVIDCDNIVDENWLVAALATVRAHDHDVVVHPSYIVTFEGRQTIWTLVASTSDAFRVELLYEYNFWDAFCVAPRTVFEAVPYAASGPALGIGPEDWHWNANTLQRGYEHVLAPETALFYRVKRSGSLMSQHDRGGSLLPWSDFFTSPEVAAIAAARPEPRIDEEPGREWWSETTDADLRRLARSIAKGGRATTAALTAVRGRVDTAPASLGQAVRAAARLVTSTSRIPPLADVRLRRPDLRDVPDADLRRRLRRAGASDRIPALSGTERNALSADLFDPDHYRLLNPDLRGFNRQEAIAHYLRHGRDERRPCLLTPEQLDALAPGRFDLADYRALNHDLAALDDRELVVHYLRSGRVEGRPSRRSALERMTERGRRVPEWLARAWRAAHTIDPLVVAPSARNIAGYGWWGDDWQRRTHPASSVFWALVRALPDGVDAVYVAPWIRLGGGDLVLERYISVLHRADPAQRIAVLLLEPGVTSDTGRLPEGVTVVELGNLAAEAGVARDALVRLVGTAIVQLSPRMIHVFNSGTGFDVVESYHRAVARDSRIFASTFVIDRGPDDEVLSWLVGRSADFLDDVEAVLVDHAAVADQFWELYRFPRSKFLVHHQPVDERAVEAASPVANEPVRLLWAGRFDRQKRLDVLAGVIESAAQRNLDVEVHVYGAAVVDDDTASALLDRLRAAGAVLHGPYTRGFSALPLASFSALLMTSEWEGIPNIMLEAMSAGLPVIAPTVGGIAEVLTPGTGYPVGAFDAVDEYVDAIADLRDHPDAAIARVEAARALMLEEFTWERFGASVRETPGYVDEPDAVPADEAESGEDADDTADVVEFFASSATAELLRDPGARVVHLANGGFGYSNFGDVLQLKAMIARWRARSDREPVLLFTIGALTTWRTPDELRRIYGCEHIVFARDVEEEAPAELVPVEPSPNDAVAHMVGGGYLNARWGASSLRIFDAYFETVGVTRLVISGMQLDEEVVPDLTPFCERWAPVLLGARDERSLRIASAVVGDRARMSFDDLSEVFDEWVAVDEPSGSSGSGRRIGVHLNTSDYVGESRTAQLTLDAVARLRAGDPELGITLVHSYDDARPEVRDTLGSWQAFGERIGAVRLETVDLAVASLRWQPGSGAPRDVVDALRRLDLAMSSSYHTAMILNRLGVPAYLVVADPYFAQKAEIFRQKPTLEEFIADPGVPVDFAPERAARARWLVEFDRFVAGP
ncbi:glycosyltransferase [Galbitalea sp. SE-J8]|uniref:glycosyltransferase n=1 Tax=Galbitalea sp. SE-J8 TaxID=3054952 RepID=UPI00259D0C5C|nr:glycosyltransferase [Galbitalea sp. SE-J8]MDM4762973.1 glycosyltransferase [Galbitalea sp. SE-J8]